MSTRRFQDRYIAYVDILGFSSLVSRIAEDRNLFALIRDTLKHLNEQTNNVRQYRRRKRDPKHAQIVRPTNLQMTAFSDCYVISETTPAWHVVAAVQALGARLLRAGILTRGAIVRGKAYHNSRILFGPAIIEAYQLESGVAVYPRILVTEEVRQEIWNYHEGLWRGNLLKHDHDGCWFVNLMVPSMSSWALVSDEASPQEAHSHLTDVRAALLDARERAKNNPAYLAKVSWLIHAFDQTASAKGMKKIGRSSPTA